MAEAGKRFERRRARARERPEREAPIMAIEIGKGGVVGWGGEVLWPAAG